jgi:hypothetical protein
VARPSQRPSEPTRPADDNVDRHRLARRQPRSRSQAPVAHRERNRPVAGPGRAHEFERPAEPLHVDPSQARGVIGERDAGPDEHGRDEPEEGGEDDPEEGPGNEAARTAPAHRPSSRADERRGRGCRHAVEHRDRATRRAVHLGGEELETIAVETSGGGASGDHPGLA